MENDDTLTPGEVNNILSTMGKEGPLDKDSITIGEDQEVTLEDGSRILLEKGDVFVVEGKNDRLLKGDKLSSAEYQTAKKLKGFNKDDWAWDKDQDLYVKKSSKKESYFGRSDDVYFKAGPNAKPWTAEDIETFYELSINGILLDEKRSIANSNTLESVPSIWDGSYDVEGSNFVMEGSLGQGGYGKIRVEVPLRKNPFVLFCEPNNDDEVYSLHTIILDRGWELL